MRKKLFILIICLLLIILIFILCFILNNKNNSSFISNKSGLIISNRELNSEDVYIKEKEIDSSIEFVNSKEYTFDNNKEKITVLFYTLIKDNNKYLYYSIYTSNYNIIHHNEYGIVNEDIEKMIKDVNIEFYSLVDVENNSKEILLKYNKNKEGIIVFSIVKDDVITNINLINNNYSKIKISKDEKVKDLIISQNNEEYNILFDKNIYEITENRFYYLEDNYCEDGSLTMHSFYFKNGVLLDDYSYINQDNIIPKECSINNNSKEDE